MRILPALAERHDVRVVLVGPNSNEGTDPVRLRNIAHSGNVEERLTIAGSRADIPVLLPAFDLLAHLPTDEAFGLALVEAMASGLPTVATNIGGCREVVRDGVTGLLVAPDDPAALQDALLELLGDPARRAAMGRAGQEIAAANFSPEPPSGRSASPLRRTESPVNPD